MKRIKILLVLLLLLGITPITTGCSNSNEPKQEETIEKSRGVVDDFSDQLFLNGKQAKMPTSLNDLGDDYTYGDKISYIDFKNDDGFQCTLGDLNYKGEFFSQIVLLNVKYENLDRNSIIYGIFTDTKTPKESFSLNSLIRGSSRDEILETLGKPSKDSDGVLQYFNKDNSLKGERIVISLDDNDKLSILILGKYPDDLEDEME
ncbi:hypothetical protein ACWG0P_15725 [Amedibacillus sp. YH-ame6]